MKFKKLTQPGDVDLTCKTPACDYSLREMYYLGPETVMDEESIREDYGGGRILLLVTGPSSENPGFEFLLAGVQKACMEQNDNFGYVDIQMETDLVTIRFGSDSIFTARAAWYRKLDSGVWGPKQRYGSHVEFGLDETVY